MLIQRPSYNHKDYQRAYQRRWREQHPDYGKEWHAANKAYVTLKKRLWRAERRKQGLPV